MTDPHLTLVPHFLSPVRSLPVGQGEPGGRVCLLPADPGSGPGAGRATGGGGGGMDRHGYCQLTHSLSLSVFLCLSLSLSLSVSLTHSLTRPLTRSFAVGGGMDRHGYDSIPYPC